MELHCRYSLLLVLVGLLGGGVLGGEDAPRRLRREIFEVESILEDNKSANGAEFGLRALKYEKSYKTKSDKSYKKDKYDKSYKKDKHDKSYKKDKYDKSYKKDKHDKSYKKDKYDKSYKKDKYDKSYKKDKHDKSYKKDKEAKYAHQATTRQVDIGGGIMMSMPLDLVMIDMSMSMSM